MIKNTDYEHGQKRMEDLVYNYSERFEQLYEEDPSNVIDYLERFNGDIEEAIESLEE